MRPVDVSLIVKEVLKLMRASLPSSIEIRQSIRKVMALADAVQIHQVVVNLCTNAAHAMEDRGILDVSLSEVLLSARDLVALSLADLKPGKHLRLSVSDTGKGMSVDTISRIFEPFFTTKRVGKGTGLGLSVVHGIVKRHGGEIRVQSELDKGSTFDIFIPVAEEVLKPEISPSQALPRGSERILLVDDEPAVVDISARVLEQLGYRVSTKTNPQDALDLFRSKPSDFDLIITDYTMPHMSGYELAMAIMKVRSDIGVILCTGFSQKVSPEAAGKMGIKGIVTKPLERKHLAQLVRSILDERWR
jgi:CheY-like chemotaxis protein